jgi:hypothetical protein
MVATKEKFSAQVATELLTALREEAQTRGCDVDSVVEDAFRFYFEAKTQTSSRPEVMAHYRDSVEKHRRLYELLAQ